MVELSGEHILTASNGGVDNTSAVSSRTASPQATQWVADGVLDNKQAMHVQAPGGGASFNGGVDNTSAVSSRTAPLQATQWVADGVLDNKQPVHVQAPGGGASFSRKSSPRG